MSFLGDPAFPRVAIESSHGGKIRLWQDLYSRYSRLGFTRDTDRPVAIAGIEQRLISSFRIRGGFGILDDTDPGLLRRSLLWLRAPDVFRLEVINFKKVNWLAPTVLSPPSWSWMAYRGAIRYLDVPFGRVEWFKEELQSPWSGSALGTWSYSRDRSAYALSLEVIVRSFDYPAGSMMEDEKITLDDPGSKTGLQSTLKCVVLGRLKDQLPKTRKANTFVLVVTPSSLQEANGTQDYKRVGAGLIHDHLIHWDEPGTTGRIR